MHSAWNGAGAGINILNDLITFPAVVSVLHGGEAGKRGRFQAIDQAAPTARASAIEPTVENMTPMPASTG
jgi:hypothetical protein